MGVIITTQYHSWSSRSSENLRTTIFSHDVSAKGFFLLNSQFQGDNNASFQKRQLLRKTNDKEDPGWRRQSFSIRPNREDRLFGAKAAADRSSRHMTQNKLQC